MKRFVDIVFAGLGLLVLSPVMAACAVTVAVTSHGPIIFKQERVGCGKRLFNLYKFRTMEVDTPPDVPTHLLADARESLTPVGGFLRKYSLDELPQLMNIVKGDMSIVGPRPALWNQQDLIEARERHGANDVRPGLTGWAQVHGRDELGIEQKAALDGYYVQHMGGLMDLKCILLSIGAVIRATGVAEGGRTETVHESVKDGASVDAVGEAERGL